MASWVSIYVDEQIVQCSLTFEFVGLILTYNFFSYVFRDTLPNHIDGVMFSVLASSALDSYSEPEPQL